MTKRSPARRRTSGRAGRSVRWNGKTDGGWAPDGDYTIKLRAVDEAGNRSAAVTRQVTVYSALGHLRSSAQVFFPQDGDRLSSTVSLGFTLASPATVDWTIRDASGAVVSGPSGRPRRWKPVRRSSHGTVATTPGRWSPRGTYRSVVSAGDGSVTVTQSVAVTADAFRISSSDMTPGRGQRVTVTAISAEGLDGAPRLRVYQPGIGSWSVAMRKTDTRVYKVTITLRKSLTGTVRLRVSADDSAGRAQSSNLYLALH